MDFVSQALQGPLPQQPLLILAWQVAVVLVLVLLVRWLRARSLGRILDPVRRLSAPVARPGRRGATLTASLIGRPWMLLLLAGILPFVEMTTGSYLLTVTYNVELYVLLAIGLNIVVGYTGLLDLGYVAFFAVGAYAYGLLASPQLGQAFGRTVYLLVPHQPGVGVHISAALLLPFAGVAAALFGILIGLPTLRLRGDYLAIVTLGFGEITRIFANNLDEPVNITNGPNGVILIDPVYLGNYSFGDAANNTIGPFAIPPFLNYYFLVLLLIVVTVFFVARLATSRVGRAWTAIREDETAAEVAGINTRNLKLLAYASGGFFGGMAGAVFAAGEHLIAPDTFQLFFSILVLCMIVVGGMGSIWGAAAGALIIGFPYFLSAQLGSLRFLMFGAVLVAMIAIRPQGLFPSGQRGRELQEVPTVDPMAPVTPEATA